jgi:hypothetical protein
MSEFKLHMGGFPSSQPLSFQGTKELTLDATEPSTAESDSRKAILLTRTLAQDQSRRAKISGAPRLPQRPISRK